MTNYSDELSLIPTPEVHPSMTAIRHDRTLKNNNNVIVPLVAFLRKFVEWSEKQTNENEARIAKLEAEVASLGAKAPAPKKEPVKS